jgi:hypothetical protein
MNNFLNASKITTLLIATGLSVGVSACGSESYTISAQPLQGKINGEPYTFSFGATNSFLSDPDAFFTTLYPGTAPADACSSLSGSGSGHVIALLPKATGEYEMSLSRNITLSYGGGNNQIITSGLIRIDSVTATEIKGGLFGESGSKFTVDGEFTAKICAPSS